MLIFMNAEVHGEGWVPVQKPEFEDVSSSVPLCLVFLRGRVSLNLVLTDGASLAGQ